jgi:hypothetical protein
MVASLFISNFDMTYKTSGIRKFIGNFLLIAVVLIILDFFIGSLLKHYYFKQKTGLLYRTTYAINSTKADILVFGSSRANHHYVSTVFQDKLHATFYNCGRDGCDMIYSVAVISAVLDRFTPKRVILEMNMDELSRNEDGKLSALLPYDDNPAIHPFIRYNESFEKYRLLSKMYPYNSLLSTILMSRYTPPDDVLGYVKLTSTMPPTKAAFFNQAGVAKYRLNILNNILKRLSDKHVATTLVISPSYYLFKEPDFPATMIKQLAQRYKNVQFFNYENNPQFLDYKLFSDEHHMNNTGAVKFSTDLANKISENQAQF